MVCEGPHCQLNASHSCCNPNLDLLESDNPLALITRTNQLSCRTIVTCFLWQPRVPPTTTTTTNPCPYALAPIQLLVLLFISQVRAPPAFQRHRRCWPIMQLHSLSSPLGASLKVRFAEPAHDFIWFGSPNATTFHHAITQVRCVRPFMTIRRDAVDWLVTIASNNDL